MFCRRAVALCTGSLLLAFAAPRVAAQEIDPIELDDRQAGSATLPAATGHDEAVLVITRPW